MRPFSKSEKRLAQTLVFVVFLVVNLLGWPFLWKKQKNLQKELVQLQTRHFSDRSWMLNKTLWLERRYWITTHQPKMNDPGEASSSLLESLQKTARNHQIDILEQSLLEPIRKPSYEEIGVRLKISGSLESIVRWLNEIQKPELFQAIQSFSLKSSADQAVITCDLHVARWYAPK